MKEEENPNLCLDILVVFKVEPDNRDGEGKAEGGEWRRPGDSPCSASHSLGGLG